MLPALFALMFRMMAPAEPCATECAGLEGTDRSTCLLQCDQGDTPRSGTGTTTWHRQENLGGAPPGSPHEGEAETVTTTTTRAADGTTTATTTTTGAKATRATPAPAKVALREDYPALARCMNGCDPQTEARPRAQCKLGCLQLSMHWRAKRSRG